MHSSFSTFEFLADFHLVSFLGSRWVPLSLLLKQLEYPKSQTLESACLGNFRQGFHFPLSVFSSIKKVGNVQLRSRSWVVRVESCLRLGTQQVVCFSLSFLTQPAQVLLCVLMCHSLSEEIIVETSKLSNKYEEGTPFKKAHVWGPLIKKEFGLCLES